MIKAGAQGEDILCRPPQDLQRGTAAFGRILHELIFQFLLELAVPGLFIRKIPDTFYNEFRRPGRELEHNLRRHLEAVERFRT